MQREKNIPKKHGRGGEITVNPPRKDGRFSMLKTDPSVRPYSRCIGIPCISLTVHVTVCV